MKGLRTSVFAGLIGFLRNCNEEEIMFFSRG